MNISLKQASEILTLTEDELMFLHQTQKIQAMVNQDTMAWEFDINEILELKANLESETAAKEESQEN